MTNMSDLAMKMIVRWLTTCVMTFTHTIPASWYAFMKVADSRDVDEVVFWQCWKCAKHSWASLPKDTTPEVVTLE